MVIRMKKHDAFKCSCGAEFFRVNEKNRSQHPCPECKGMGRLTKDPIRPKPIWKDVTERKPFCPRCNWEIERARGDVGTIWSWHCRNPYCNYVC